MKNDADIYHNYGRSIAYVEDDTAGAEGGSLIFYVSDSGTLAAVAKMIPQGIELASSKTITNAGGTPNIGEALNPFGTGHLEAVNLGDEDLDTYDAGTWTPAEATVTLTTKTGRYVAVGESVHVSCDLTWPATADANDAVVSGLPYTTANQGDTSRGGLSVAWIDYGSGITVRVDANATTVRFYDLSGTALTNADLSGKTIQLGGTYEAA